MGPRDQVFSLFSESHVLVELWAMGKEITMLVIQVILFFFFFFFSCF